MAKATFLLLSERERGFAAAAVMRAPLGHEVVISGTPKRTREQNARLHAILTDIADQLPWPKDTGELHGVEWWKRRCTLGWIKEMKKEREAEFIAMDVEIIVDFEGEDFGLLLPHTSDLPVDKFAALTEWTTMFGATNGVVFREPEPKDEAPPWEEEGYEAFR